jgi:outer membrane lipoprotein-sorting protein
MKRMGRPRFGPRLALAALVTVALAGAAPLARADEPPPRAAVGPGELDALLADITRARKDLRTLRATFTQERKIALLHTSVTSRGELTFAAPDRLRWELAPPDDITYFVGPEGLAYRTKSSSAAIPASGANIGRALGDLRALLAGDLGALRDRYELSASRGPADVEVAGRAKDPKASVRAFTLTLDKGLVVPLRARLAEGKSDSIDLTFANVTVNGPVDPARLRP